MSTPVIRLERVTVAYRSRVALRAVDLTIGAGERVALIGPNGAGKSTFLGAATGVIQPSGGEVLLDGRSVR